MRGGAPIEFSTPVHKPSAPRGPKRFSDKLSLVYEQGLSVANNALKIEYALSRTVTLRVEVGFVNGFGIYYSRSFD